MIIWATAEGVSQLIGACGAPGGPTASAVSREGRSAQRLERGSKNDDVYLVLDHDIKDLGETQLGQEGLEKRVGWVAGTSPDP